MKTRLISISVAVVLISGGIQVAADASGSTAGDAATGATKVGVCQACHGPNGNSLVSMWPKLAGQHAKYIQKQLMDFKSGARKDPQMNPQAATLSDEDIRDIAAYYSKQQQTPGPAADPAVAEQGKQIYLSGNPATGMVACSGCHGPKGAGVGPARFPRIAGQHAQYLEATLKGFRAETRANDQNSTMRNVAARMSDKEITDVSQYLQGLTTE